MSVLQAAVAQSLAVMASDYRISSYRADFASLWSKDGEARRAVCDAGAKSIIVWDETPPVTIGAVRLGEYLSPYDLAVVIAPGLSAEGDRSRPNDPHQPTSLVIWDGHRPSGTYKPADALRAAQLGSLRPLRFLSVVGQRIGCELVDLAIATSPLETQSYVRPPADEDARDGVRRMWANALCQPADVTDHHALANLVGPSLLFGTADVSPSTSALNQLFEAAGVLPSAPQRTPKDLPWVSRGTWNSQIERFVVVDDLANQGWARFMAEALDAKDRLEVWTSPDHLLGQLPDAQGIAQRKGLPGLENAVLFLDLRLFAFDALERECAFVQRLLALAAKAGIEFNLEAVGRWLKTRDRATPDYWTTLALFPAILASADPFLPIVIFSSTGRRTTTDALRRFSNIVVDFEKPRLDGRDIEAIRRDAKQRLKRAIKQVVHIARARSFCRRVERMPAPVAVESSPAHATLSIAGKWPCAHVFVEENEGGPNERHAAGTPHRRDTFVVGGLCLLLGDVRESALTAINDALAKDGLFWGLGRGQDPRFPADALPDKWLRKFPLTPGVSGHAVYREQDRIGSEWMDSVDRCVRSQGAAIFAFCLESRRDRVVAPGVDIGYRQMLSDVLELLVSTVLPRYVTDEAVVGFHVATRASVDWPKDPITMTAMDPAKAEGRFGLHRFKGSRGEDKYQSLGRDHVHWLARELCTNRKWRLSWARGVPLFNFDMDDPKGSFSGRDAWLCKDPSQKERAASYARLWQKPSQRPEQIHYAADWVTRLARSEPQGATRSWFEAGFHDTYDNAQAWLACLRAFTPQRPEDAVEKAYVATRGNAPTYPSTAVARWILADAASWIPALAQDDMRFRRLVNRMRR
jgi:hypothetical protein